MQQFWNKISSRKPPNKIKIFHYCFQHPKKQWNSVHPKTTKKKFFMFMIFKRVFISHLKIHFFITFIHSKKYSTERRKVWGKNYSKDVFWFNLKRRKKSFYVVLFHFTLLMRIIYNCENEKKGKNSLVFRYFPN